MVEFAVIGSFLIIVLTSVILNLSILNALVLGYVLFFIYALAKKFTIYEILKMSWQGIKTVKNIVITFVWIGMLTAVWRDSGTIAYLIYYAANLITPAIFILITFLLCCFISVLTGTAFGTVATVGVICMMLANTMTINPIFVGGAILSGIYFGDRCSPMSTSALLVSELTQTNIYGNIKNMVRTSVLPFIITCFIYALMSLNYHGSVPDMEIWHLFNDNFHLSIWVTLPAIIIIGLSLLRVKVRNAMAISVLVACIISLTLQNTSLSQLANLLVMGFHSPEPQLAMMLDGGGVISMLNVMAIVCLSACYAGIFAATDLLKGIKNSIIWLSDKFTPYGSIFISSILTAMLTCNQALSIMLTHYLCKDTMNDNRQLAVNLENTAVVIAPLIPWSIACAVPLATAGAPIESIYAACYLYLLPLYNWFSQKKYKTKNK